MYKWAVNYSNYIECIYKSFTIKARSFSDAIEAAIKYINKKYYINDRRLNNYKINLIY